MASEKLVYVSWDVDGGNLIVQLSGGGAMQPLQPKAEATDVIGKLRTLADDLERGVAERAKNKLPPKAYTLEQMQRDEATAGSRNETDEKDSAAANGDPQ